MHQNSWFGHSPTWSLSLFALIVSCISFYHFPSTAKPGHPLAQSGQQLKGEDDLDYDADDSEPSVSINHLELVIQELHYPVIDLDYPVIDLYTVTETGDEILIELAADILFDFDRSSLKSSAFSSLRAAARRIRETAGDDVRIEGHTDSKGSISYNQTLSEARAQSVRDWLVNNGNLADFKFVVSGHGETKPVQQNQTDQGEDNPAGRQRNRRVEIIIDTSG